MNSVVHFEMPAKDKKRTAKFYENVFGWKMNQLGSDMGNYLMAQTTEVDANNMALKPGAINGGFFKRGKAGTIPNIIISVENIKTKMNEIKAAGGEIIGEIVEIPTVGTFVMFKDTEGNKVGMLQPIM